MRFKLVSFLCAALAVSAIAEEIPFVSLPDAYTFETKIKKVCASRPGLKICRSSSPTTYCNVTKFDCSNIENHNTLIQFIALERRIDINCIASVGSNITIHEGRQTKFATYSLVKSKDCQAGL